MVLDFSTHVTSTSKLNVFTIESSVWTPLWKQATVQFGHHTPLILIHATYFMKTSERHSISNTQVKALDNLRAAIENEIKEFVRDLLQKTIANFHSTLQNVISSDGEHLENLLYWKFSINVDFYFVFSHFLCFSYDKFHVLLTLSRYIRRLRMLPFKIHIFKCSIRISRY